LVNRAHISFATPTTCDHDAYLDLAGAFNDTADDPSLFEILLKMLLPTGVLLVPDMYARFVMAERPACTPIVRATSTTSECRTCMQNTDEKLLTILWPME
jgi:hypothetical protein